MPTVSVYVSQKVLDEAEKRSTDQEISLSKALLQKDPFVGNKVFDPSAEIFKKLDLLEAKIESLISEMDKKIDLSKGHLGRVDAMLAEMKPKIENPLIQINPVSESSDAEIQAANERLKERRKKIPGHCEIDLVYKSLEMEAGRKPESLPGWTGGISKDRQVGKKGVK